MKKIFTASLVAMMAVTAANADIASTGYVNQRTGENLTGFAAEKGNLNEAVNALKTELGTVSGTAGAAVTKSELQTAKDDLQAAINTEKGRIDAADLTAVGAEGSFISSVSQTDGKVAAAPTAFVSKIEGAAEGSLVAPQTKAVVDYVGVKMGEINGDMSTIQGSISDLKSDVSGLTNALDAEETARANADTAINSKIGEVAEGKTVVGLIDEAKQAASGANTELAGRVTANENSIKEINDSDVMQSGVKAATVAQVETNKTDIANIKTEQTTQNNNISALQTSLAEGGATAKAIEDAQAAADKAQGEVDTLEGVVAQNKTDAATAASNAETAAKTYADEKVAALDSSIAVEAGKVVTGVTVVDGKITASEKMALTALANFPVACSDQDTHCALTIDGGNLKWEVVK